MNKSIDIFQQGFFGVFFSSFLFFSIDFVKIGIWGWTEHPETAACLRIPPSGAIGRQ